MKNLKVKPIWGKRDTSALAMLHSGKVNCLYKWNILKYKGQ
uniref:Uncharacterized protein n=1 Tax=Ciona intestinalis TaxID=7719 RepID=H2XKM8_CIOIN